METKKGIIFRFMGTPLKNPDSRRVLQFLLQRRQLLENAVFVDKRDMLPDTLLVTQQGSNDVGFELELGVQQFEEVSIVNGRLVRNLRKTSRLCVHEPEQAISALQDFAGKLFVKFSFAGETPAWYQQATAPNPVESEKTAGQDVDDVMDEITRDQLDLALWTIILRSQIDKALAARDEAGFRKYVRLYNKVREHCLWEFE